MSTTVLVTLINPGAETGDTTGWTGRSASNVPKVVTSSPHTGSFRFVATQFDTTTAIWDQQVEIDSTLWTPIDAGGATATGRAWHITDGTDSGALYLQAIGSNGTTVLATIQNAQTKPVAYTQETVTLSLPAGTRFLRLGTNNAAAFSVGDRHSYWDDFDLSVTYNGTATPWVEHARGLQLGVYVLGTFPSSAAKSSQMGQQALVASQTSSGLYLLSAHQLGAYALCKPNGDKRKLRAWTFPQDDHKFYVLQLGNENGTLIYDTLTQQWATWTSPDEVFWRGEDGCAWEGFNVACDTLSGKIFKIDAEGRLDYNDTTTLDDTPIRSVVVGGLTKRFRNSVPCYMAELAISEGQPPTGIDPATVGLSLRSHDTLTSYDHGTVSGVTAGDGLTVRWYGLGLMSYPGRVFEITDTGYARRIDGFNIEVGGVDSGNQ